MSLAKKFIIVIFGCILFIAITNIISFYFFYSSYLKVFLVEKINSKSEVSLEYINTLILKQWVDDVDAIFDDVSISLFEKLWDDNVILLNSKENVDIVIDYLLKSWVAPKYIEDIVPTNNFEKVLEAIKDKESPEYKFIRSIFISIILVNIFAIAFVSIFIFLFVQRTLIPIKEITKEIKDLQPWKTKELIEYKRKDEVWLLISSINDLNKRLFLQENIRSKLLADISHELKTPITSIQCYLEWIMDGVIQLNDKNLAWITSEMERLIQLVDKIMQYEQFENSSLELKNEKFKIFPLLLQLVETYKTTIVWSSNKISVIGNKDLMIDGDPDLCKQLAYNLIWNFIKYSWEWAKLTINITNKFIDFNDNWIWIDYSEIPFLTEKFYQGDTSKSKNIDERWIGVWLSIVGKIIQAHDWSFKIHSDKGKWFSFKIYIS